MKRYSILFLLVLFCFAFPPSSPAEIYKWTDKNGVVHFGSEAGDPSAQLVREKDLPQMFEASEPPQSSVMQTTSYSMEKPITIQLLHENNPLSKFTSATPIFYLFNFGLKQWVKPKYTYDAATSTFELSGIAEGKYNAQVTVDAEPSNPERYAGDYEGSLHFSLGPSVPASYIMEVTRILHIISPEDNAGLITDWGTCSSKLHVQAPFTIAWEPLGEGVSYLYTIHRTACPFAPKEIVAGDSTTASKIVISLPPNKDDEFYTMKIEARKNDKVIGTFVVHRKNGWNWDYRFRVIPKRGPTKLISPNTQ
jgi:hypothetical protein